MSSLPPTSRYYPVEQKMLELPDGTSIPYLGRRFVPLPERFATLEMHTVEQGERPDQVAYQHLGDPEQFWRICDANGVLYPEELTERPGSQIRITLPEGIPGQSNA
jgi:hypothetical protein